MPHNYNNYLKQVLYFKGILTYHFESNTKLQTNSYTGITTDVNKADWHLIHEVCDC